MTEIDTATLVQLTRHGPRYTSYPTAPVWTKCAMDGQKYRELLRQAAKKQTQPLSLYLHIPFCRHQCLYCGCNMVVTRKQERGDVYIDYLSKEMGCVARDLGDRQPVAHLHLGGGTPTFLNEVQLTRLWTEIGKHFSFLPDAELAIECDPRVTTIGQLELLRELGFNRLSLGVQDLSAAVQEAIGRHQTAEETEMVYRTARRLGFARISMDLVYGLPKQSLSEFAQTLDKVCDLRPNRIALFSYAHVPWLRPAQRKIDEKDLPAIETRIELFLLARRTFLTAGYEEVGMDHFALPDDELAIAQRSRTLYRNFQGYAPRPTGDTIAFGVSAIGDVQGGYVQNVKSLAEYYQLLAAGTLPVERGWMLTAEDCLRRDVIRELMCNFFVDLETQARVHQLSVTLFEKDLEKLQEGTNQDLVNRIGWNLEVTSLGRFAVRNIAMAFDQYLPSNTTVRPLFSQTV